MGPQPGPHFFMSVLFVHYTPVKACKINAKYKQGGQSETQKQTNEYSDGVPLHSSASFLPFRVKLHRAAVIGQLQVKHSAVNEKRNRPLQVPHEGAVQTVRRAGHAR